MTHALSEVGYSVGNSPMVTALQCWWQNHYVGDRVSDPDTPCTLVSDL